MGTAHSAISGKYTTTNFSKNFCKLSNSEIFPFQIGDENTFFLVFDVVLLDLNCDCCSCTTSATVTGLGSSDLNESLAWWTSDVTTLKSNEKTIGTHCYFLYLIAFFLPVAGPITVRVGGFYATTHYLSSLCVQNRRHIHIKGVCSNGGGGAQICHTRQVKTTEFHSQDSRTVVWHLTIYCTSYPSLNHVSISSFISLHNWLNAIHQNSFQTYPVKQWRILCRIFAFQLVDFLIELGLDFNHLILQLLECFDPSLDYLRQTAIHTPHQSQYILLHWRLR